MQRYIKEGNDFMSMENEFVKMNILTQTKPGVPNVNGYTYSQEVYDNIVTRIQDHHRFIPIIKEPRQGFCFNKDTASINISILDNEKLGCNLLGLVRELFDDHITVEIKKKHEDMVKTLLDDGYKASMIYYGEIDGNTVTKIKNIAYFSLDKVRE